MRLDGLLFVITIASYVCTQVSSITDIVDLTQDKSDTTHSASDV